MALQSLQGEFVLLRLDIMLALLLAGTMAEPVITSLTRTIMVTSNHPVEVITLSLAGTGHSFSYVWPEHLNLKIVAISFQQNKKFLHFQSEDQRLLVKLDHPETDLTITVDYLGRYENLPKSISSNEDQAFRLHDSSAWYSAYPVKTQSLVVEFERLLEVSPGGTKERNKARFELNKEMPALSWKPVWAHGVNNRPQMQFHQVERKVEVSHWGNIYIEQVYKLTNLGPGPSGEFSRIDYTDRSAKNAFRQVSAMLPADTWGLYYRDEVGNITTSRAKRTSKGVDLNIQTRFMLLGGWNSNFTIAYNLPSGKYLSTDGEQGFKLHNIPLLYEFDSIAAARYRLQVVLPEGASPVLEALKQLPTSLTKTFSYLDFEGRPTLVFELGPALGRDQHSVRMLEVLYMQKRSPWMQWLYCVGAVTGLFVGGAILGQINLETLDVSYEEDRKII